jgi:hypothetical protein
MKGTSMRSTAATGPDREVVSGPLAGISIIGGGAPRAGWLALARLLLDAPG